VICFDEKPFKNILVHGIVTDIKKRKMSKSEGNDVKPAEVITKYNRDFLRYYLIKNSDGSDIAFNWNDFDDISRFFNVFLNTYNFLSLYLSKYAGKKPDMKELQTEDLWLLSRLNTLQVECEKNYEQLTFCKITALIEQFVMEDLSRTYIKLIRDRVGGPTEQAVAATLNETMNTLLRLLAPVMPHAAEYLYQDMRDSKMPESIHLFEFPELQKKLIDKELETQMDFAKTIIQTSLSLREEQKLRLRWPLKGLVVRTKTGKELKRVLPIIASSANVKDISETTSSPKGSYAEKSLDESTSLFLNIETDSELEEEWELMELRRRIQDQRKQAKLMPQQKVELFISSSDASFLKKYSKQIEKETNTSLVLKEGAKEKLLKREFYIEIKK
jgi:isoleucyl-tRNA synthetase